MSPRPALRLDTPDGAGGWLHRYRHAAWPQDEPAGPYGVYLTDASGRFRLLCFDLDASKGPVEPDLARLRGLLDELGVPHVVTRSGPAGGVHVWVGVPAGARAGLVEAVARMAGRWLPTLDYGLLCNPAAGVARPPGAPHRDGGRSVLLDPVDVPTAAAMLRRGADELALRRMVDRLAALAPPPHSSDTDEATATPAGRRGDTATATTAAGRTAATVPDVGGRVRLAGRPVPRDELDAPARTALGTRPAGDASDHLFSVLLLLAHRRWSWPMVRQLLDDPTDTPGLEHVRTTRGRSGHRVPRAPGAPLRVLDRQWRRAVKAAARFAAAYQVDPAHEAAVGAVLAHAATTPDRWTGPAGPADLAVLEALCWLARAAGDLTVYAPIRRLALNTGRGKSTAHRALRRLAWDGWLELEDAAKGSAAAVVRVGVPGGRGVCVPPPVTCNDTTAMTQHREIAAGVGARLGVYAHDTFTTRRLGGLGHPAARTYAALQTTSEPLTVPALAQRVGYSIRAVSGHLSRLQRYRLARGNGSGWRVARRGLTAVAHQLGTHGIAADRARRYGLDQAVHDWWLAELEWMHSPKTGLRTGPRLVPEQTTLPTGQPDRPQRRYPRDRTGRADHDVARHLLDPAAAPLPPRLADEDQDEAAALALLADRLGAEPIPAGARGG